MPFPYRYICDLLQQLDDEVRKSPPKWTPSEAIVQTWFQQHQSLLHEPGNDACAILSMLLPGRRTDRVYGIQARRLKSIFGRAIGLGKTRVQEMRIRMQSGGGDLGDSVEFVLRQTPNSCDDTTHLDVEEIDETLGRIAAACEFSSPAVRDLYQTSDVCDSDTLLGKIYLRLGSRDAKWFTRLVLKDYQPVVMNAHVVFSNYHPLLPQIMKIRDDLSVATAYARQIDGKRNSPSTIADHLKPQLGVKVGRQPWFKGRSIKNCIDMAKGRDVICEQKIDGEYCQIHIDLRKPRRRNRIQIFSKSGKDSTEDRDGLHNAIRDSLKIGSEDCPLTTGCILEGELVVYSTIEHRILPFHKIRKHVSRSGSFLGTKQDSQAHDYEHLMIIFYDVLLIDDESLLGVKNSERFRRLSEMITCREGYAELVSRTTIRTSRPSAVRVLRELFAQCIVTRREGLVLKLDEPYFDFTPTFRRYGCCNIKLKKGYITGFGDIGDLAVVGALYNPEKAKKYKYKIPNAKWTDFFIGCLENKDQVRAKTEKPKFRITNVVELTGPTLSTFWAQGSPITVPYKEKKEKKENEEHEENTFIQLEYTGSAGKERPTAVFTPPLVFDMRCFGFDKEPNTEFWSMRFPQVDKVHHDRTYLDTITFSELQEIAEEETNVPEEVDRQEMRQWVKALEAMDRGKFSVNVPSQATTCSDFPPSPSSTASSQWTPRQPEHGLPTDPRSSAVELAAASARTESRSSARSVANHDKRRATELSGSSYAVKRRCTQSSPSSVNSSQKSTLTDSSFSQTRHRDPLSQLDPNAPEKHRTGVERLAADSSSKPPSAQDDTNLAGASSPAAYYTASEMGSSSPSRATETRRDLVTTRSQGKVNSTCSACCSIASHECLLARCSILLAPCISSYAWVTEDLLKRHGVVDPLLDPRVWKNKDLYSSTCRSANSFETGSTPTSTSVKRPRIRKICLVEVNRIEATKAFVQKIKDINLRTRNGERDWVEIYDWKVLEIITKQEEAQGKPSKGTDPWKPFYRGLV